ncbi:MAG: right-handed parallel beta-helix repeat-containing protein [Patescibacteria group bacterium]
MKKFLLFPILMLGFLFCLPVMAADWYVDGDNGSDATGAGTEATPYATISKAVTMMAASDTVYCRGTVTDNVSLPAALSGSSETPTTFTAWGDDTCNINGSNNAVVIGFANGSNYFNINGVSVTNFSTAGIYSIDLSNSEINDNIISGYGIAAVGIFLGGSDNIISENEVYGTSVEMYGIYIPGSSNLIIERNTLHDLGGFGIGVEGNTTDITVRNNLFYDIGSDDAYPFSSGVIMQDTDGATIVNNTFFNLNDDVNNPAGIIFVKDSGTAQDAYIYNNIFHTTDRGIWVDNITLPTLQSDYNNFYNVTTTGRIEVTDYTTLADWQGISGADTNSITSDPLLASTIAGSEDLHLTNDSPCIDTGYLVSSNTNDYDNETRPYNVTDRGADERPVLFSAPISLGNDSKVKQVTFDWLMDSTYPVTGYTLEVGTASDLAGSTEYELDNSAQGTVTGLKGARKYYAAAMGVYTTDYASYYSDYSGTLTLSTKPAQVKKLKNLNTVHNYSQWRWKKQKRVRNYVIKLMNKKGKKIKLIQITKKKKFVQGKKKNVKKIISKLKSGKTYKIKIRAKKKVNDIWYKGKWSKVKRFSTPSDPIPEN